MPEVEETHRLYAITELANELGVTPRAIRFYESKGLLEPQRATSTSGSKTRGATAEGKKELAMADGYREASNPASSSCWACDREVWRSIRNWPRRTAPWSSGKR